MTARREVSMNKALLVVLCFVWLKRLKHSLEIARRRWQSVYVSIQQCWVQSVIYQCAGVY